MKKIYLIFALAATLTACGGNKEDGVAQESKTKIILDADDPQYWKAGTGAVIEYQAWIQYESTPGKWGYVERRIDIGIYKNTTNYSIGRFISIRNGSKNSPEYPISTIENSIKPILKLKTITEGRVPGAYTKYTYNDPNGNFSVEVSYLIRESKWSAMTISYNGDFSFEIELDDVMDFVSGMKSSVARAKEF